MIENDPKYITVEKYWADNAIKELKKQTPKKMTHLIECANEGYYCTNCHKKLSLTQTKKYKYCWNCGQKLDWDNINEG